MQLKIKDLNFNSNLVQGPLAGVSCAPFRVLPWLWGELAFSYTEMISAKTLIYKPKYLQRRFIEKHPDEGPVCFQLSSKDPIELGIATKMVTEYGADLIDLNCGCPKRKMRKKGTGSHLLSEAGKIFQLVTAMKNNTSRPISIKIRVDAKSNDHFNQDIANAIRDAGADFITVHGRHWTHDYDVSCSYDDISFFVDALDIPVIGNGDIACLDSLNKMLSTGCAAAMISRAAVGQPWLFQKLQSQANGDVFPTPSLQTRGELFLQHIEGLSGFLRSEKSVVTQARCFAKYYARGEKWQSEFLQAFNQCEDMFAAKNIIESFYGVGRCKNL